MYRASSDLLAKSAYLLITVLAARRLSRDAFGLLALGTTLGWIAGVVTDAGLQLHIARSVARVADRQQDVAAIFRRWVPWRLGAAAVGLLVAAGLAQAWTPSPAAMLAVVLFTASGICGSFTEFFNHVCRGLSRTDIESTIAIVSRLLLLGIAGAVLTLRPGAVPLGVAWCAIALLTTVVTAIATHRLASGDASAVRRLSATTSRQREFIAEVLPVGLATVLSALYFRIDVLLLQQWQGTAAVGAYNAVFRIIEGLRLYPAAALAVALPALCRADSTQPMRRLAGRLGLVAAAVAGILAVASDRLVPWLFGPAFADAVTPGRILLLAFPLMTVNYVLTTQLVAWNRQASYAWLCAVALVVNLALNRAWIPTWSSTGAAWATVLTEVCIFAGSLWLLRQASGVRTRALAASPMVTG